ncbi:hypothetical protein FRC02_011844 [Tulasnella sp. 418]|nr:hypothetical protein FRC02_011844 [Tulasnella sp. 418]
MYTPQKRQQEDERKRRSTGKSRQDLNGDDGSEPRYPDVVRADIPTPTSSSVVISSVFVRDQQEGGLHRMQQRATVVTVTATASSTNTPASSNNNSSSSEIPIGIIVGAVLVGVVIAVGAVAGWIWWGKRIQKKNKKLLANKRPTHKPNTSSSSTARLAANAASMGSHEKHVVSFNPNNNGTTGRKPAASGGNSQTPRASQSTPPTHPSRGPTSTPASTTTPSHTHSNTPSTSTLSHTSSPSTEKLPTPDVTTSPPKGVPGSLGNKYQPAKSSPLAAGQTPYKPVPREKTNEWASGFGTNAHVAINASSQGASSTSAQTTSNPAPTTNGGNTLEIPNEQRMTGQRMSVQSAMSAGSQYDDEYEYGDAPIGMAYGGDDVDPAPAYQYPPNLPRPGDGNAQGGYYQYQSNTTDSYGNMKQGYLGR